MSQARQRAPELAVRTCLLLSHLFSAGPLARYGTWKVEQTASLDAMVSDRVTTVPSYHALFSPFCQFKGQTVLELGCSRGYLLAAFREMEDFRAIGVDRDPIAVADGIRRYGDRIEFVQSDDLSIPLPDASCDTAYTVDTVEHLSKPEAIFREIHRILRPGGRFLIHFHPWYGPYGAHLIEILPSPGHTSCSPWRLCSRRPRGATNRPNTSGPSITKTARLR
jgi:SAM-dependent methyltransferase